MTCLHKCLEDPKLRFWAYSLLAIGVILTVILVPMSFSYVNYYEYGLVQRRTTGSVDTAVIYTSGRYNLGPDYIFLKYQADAHVEQLSDIGVFSAGGSDTVVGLSFKIDVFWTYFINQSEVGKLHDDYSLTYRENVISRTTEAIKNEAIFVNFTEYLQHRSWVEQRFRTAVEASWNRNPPLYCSLDQFFLGRIEFDESVANKLLEAKIQNELTDREKYIQQAQVERELTSVEVNSIILEQIKVLRTAYAESNLTIARANAEASHIIQDAQTNGTAATVEAVSILKQDQVMSFTYARSLADRNTLQLTIDYLSDENIVKTRDA